MKILGQGAEKLHAPYILVSDVPDKRKAKKKKHKHLGYKLLVVIHFYYLLEISYTNKKKHLQIVIVNISKHNNIFLDV